jgi:glycosyltransferase involved in cell wall biosynthesis
MPDLAAQQVPSAFAPTTRPLRLLLLSRALTIGGSERQLVQLAAGLSERGHVTTLSTFYGGDAFLESLVGTRVALCSFGKRGRWDLRRFLLRVRSEIHRLKPDVIYTFLPPANVAIAAMRTFLPRHGLIWGVRASNLDLARYDALSRLVINVERRLSGVPDVIIANSEAGRRHAVAQGFPARRLQVVPNGIDTSRFRPFDLERRRAARVALDLPSDTLTIGIVARLDPMKDLENFFQALSRVTAQRKVSAVIAGPPVGAGRRLLEEIVANLGIAGHLRWLGPVRDVRQVYAALDLLCLPSAFGEGFPNVLGEAMACGLPCVVTDVGDCRSILGESGMVVPPSNPEALAQALLSASDHTTTTTDRHLIQRLRQRVIDHYSVERMITRTEELLLCARGAALS